MPKQSGSQELREYIGYQLWEGLTSAEDVVASGRMSATGVQKLVDELIATQGRLTSQNQAPRSGRPRKLRPDSEKMIHNLVEMDSTAYLDDLQQVLEEHGHGDVSLSTVSRTLTRVDYTLKKVHRYASQQSPELRNQYRERIGKYSADQLVFVDESSFDSRVFHRQYGRSLKGTKAFVRSSISRGARYSLLPAVALDKGMFATLLVEGSVTGRVFFEYLRDVLLPECQPFPAPRSVIVCDNASVHKNPALIEMVEAAGCKMEYLPPYSPDFNPIEKCFSKIKQVIKRQTGLQGMAESIREAIEHISLKDIKGYYRFSQYV
ncbi:unnamed protein product [Sympodiomycopsis kandeliae]